MSEQTTHAWDVTFTHKDDPKKAHNHQRIEGDYPNVHAVRDFVEKNWAHVEFVEAKPVNHEVTPLPPGSAALNVVPAPHIQDAAQATEEPKLSSAGTAQTSGAGPELPA